MPMSSKSSKSSKKRSKKRSKKSRKKSTLRPARKKRRGSGIPVRCSGCLRDDRAAVCVCALSLIHLRSLLLCGLLDLVSDRDGSVVWLPRVRGQQRGSGVPVRYSDCPRGDQAVVWVPARSAFSPASLPTLM